MQDLNSTSFSNLPKILAIDFDGTLVSDNFPNIGELNTKLFKEVKTLQEEFGVKIILWTSRTLEMLDDAVKFCEDNGLKFDAVNQNIKEVMELTGQDTRKVYADLYIDDKAIPAFQDPLYWVNKLGVEANDFQKRAWL